MDEDRQVTPEDQNVDDAELAEQIAELADGDPDVQAMMDRIRGRTQPIDMAGAKDLPIATLDDLKKLRDLRVEQAVAFPIEALGMKVMVAKCAYATYHSILTEMFNEDSGDMGAASAKLQGKILQACMLEPKLDDEGVSVLMEAAGDDILPLIGFCRRFSGIDSSNQLLMTGVEAAEDFTRSAR
jgi:hypothetical protein